ncbi:hypothetical protein ACROYT_G013926 [Oculina patagonica]
MDAVLRVHDIVTFSNVSRVESESSSTTSQEESSSDTSSPTIVQAVQQSVKRRTGISEKKGRPNRPYHQAMQKQLRGLWTVLLKFKSKRLRDFISKFLPKSRSETSLLPNRTGPVCLTKSKEEPIRIPILFKDQRSADKTRKQLQSLDSKNGVRLQLVFTSLKIERPSKTQGKEA